MIIDLHQTLAEPITENMALGQWPNGVGKQADRRKHIRTDGMRQRRGEVHVLPFEVGIMERCVQMVREKQIGGRHHKNIRLLNPNREYVIRVTCALKVQLEGQIPSAVATVQHICG